MAHVLDLDGNIVSEHRDSVMKKIRARYSLSPNHCEEITMMELRASPGEVVRYVEMGGAFIITKAGRKIAALVPLSEADLIAEIKSDGKITYRSPRV